MKLEFDKVSASNRKLTNKCHLIPGWNRVVKSAYELAQGKYLLWVKNGRNRDCELYLDMKEARKLFKSKLKECKSNEDREINNIAIQEKFSRKNKHGFWNEIRKHKEIRKQI